jgi:membrane-associated phospholipid phosphatase
MRRDQDENLGVRLAMAAGGAVVLLVPFAVIAALIVARAGWLRSVDAGVTDALHDFAVGHAGWVRFMDVWSLVFAPMVFRVAAAGLVVWLCRRRAWRTALWVAVTMIAGGVLGVVLKLLFGRHRPDLLDPVAHAPGYSFPSGHALTSALGSAVFLLALLPLVREHPRRRAALWAAAVVVPVITGLSRIFLGVHWTSDVVAGWLLGVAVVAATAAAFLATRRGRRPDVAVEGLDPREVRPG